MYRERGREREGDREPDNFPPHCPGSRNKQTATCPALNFTVSGTAWLHGSLLCTTEHMWQKATE